MKNTARSSATQTPTAKAVLRQHELVAALIVHLAKEPVVPPLVVVEDDGRRVAVCYSKVEVAFSMAGRSTEVTQADRPNRFEAPSEAEALAFITAVETLRQATLTPQFRFLPT